MRKGLSKMQYSVSKQSDMHNILKTFFSRDATQNKLFSQSTKRLNENNTKIIILDNMAYWVKDNIFYVSSLVNGKPNVDDTVPVDINNMPKTELDKMLFILDNLSGGKNERGGSGN
jgi:hypothetical protein